MVKLLKKLVGPLVSLFFLLNMTSAGYAETTVSAEVGFIFNTFLFLVCGFLVMFMAAGFAMLESGMVTSKSVSVICAKNIGPYSLSRVFFTYKYMFQCSCVINYTRFIFYKNLF